MNTGSIIILTERVTIVHYFAMAAAFVLIWTASAIGQTEDFVRPEAAPPKILVLVYQRFAFDKSADGGKALAAAARACANLDVPNSWIVSDSITGEPEVLSFDRFDSFAHVGKLLPSGDRFTRIIPGLQSSNRGSTVRW